MGTGIVIDERGFIVTNQHVIDGVEKIQVTLADGSTHTAKLVAADKQTDLAVIRVPLTDPLPTITIGKSDDLMTGEPVIAVGNAYGYEHTVTRGIISALHRMVQLSDTQKYENLIQTGRQYQPGQLRRTAAEHRRSDDRHQRGRASRCPRHWLLDPRGRSPGKLSRICSAANDCRACGSVLPPDRPWKKGW